jgi:hypothetical protein
LLCFRKEDTSSCALQSSRRPLDKSSDEKADRKSEKKINAHRKSQKASPKSKLKKRVFVVFDTCACLEAALFLLVADLFTLRGGQQRRKPP